MGRGLSNVGDLVAIQSLHIVLFHQGFDVLLDVGDFRREARFDLLDYLLDKLDVLHSLTRFHDADDGGLRICQLLVYRLVFAETYLKE